MGRHCSYLFILWLSVFSFSLFGSRGMPPPWLQDPDEFIDSMGNTHVDEDEPAEWFLNREDLNGGTVTSTIGSGNDAARAGVIQSDGKVVVGGRTSNDGANDFALMRFYPDGSIDTAYGTNGRIITTFGTGVTSDEIIHSMAIQTDGKVVAAGKYYTDTGDYKFALARYNTNGTLDTSFNQTGKVSTNILGGADIARAVAIDTTARIMVGGYGYNSTKWDSILTRFLSDGALDTSYFTTGIRSFAFNANDNSILAMQFNTVGEIYTAGAAYNGTDFDFAVSRFMTDGRYDTSFNSTGRKTINLNGNDFAYAIAHRDEGGSVSTLINPVGGTTSGSSTYIGIAQLRLSGSFDTSFQSTGKTSLSLPAGYTDSIPYGARFEMTGGVAYPLISIVGKALISGTTGNWDFLAVRVVGGGGGANKGFLDTTFSSDGYAITSMGTGEDAAQGLMFMGEDVFYAAGRSKIGSNYNFAVARFDTDGMLAPSGTFAKGFGTGGKQATNVISGVAERLWDAAVTPNDALVGVGEYVTGAVIKPYMVRYMSNGLLDPTFGTSGKLLFSAYNGTAMTVTVESDGRTVMAGKNGSTGTLMISRFTTSGSYDTTFGTAGFNYPTALSGFSGMGIALDYSGRYLVAGGTAAGADYSFTIARFTTDGILDTSFSSNGFDIPLSGSKQAQSVVVDPTSNLITVLGYNAAPGYAILVRYTTDGFLDTSFFTTGKQTSSYANRAVEAYEIFLNSAGQYIVGGNSALAGVVYGLMTRYTSDGRFDTTFHTDGYSEDGYSGNFSYGSVLAENDKLYTSHTNFWLQRFNADGTVDTSFNTNGRILMSFTSGGTNYQDWVVLRKGGQVCIGGAANSNTESAVACAWQ